MNKKAIIFDLDNTIYPVLAIGDKLFEPLFGLIAGSKHKADIAEIKLAIQQKPFQCVAEQFGMSDQLTKQAVGLLQELTCTQTLETFPGYRQIRSLPQSKYLVTAGFTKLQLSKIACLGIRNDFDGIYIMDRSISNDTKKDAFCKIAATHHYRPQDILIVGDDLYSEIKAGAELGIDALWLDSFNLGCEIPGVKRIARLEEVSKYVSHHKS